MATQIKSYWSKMILIVLSLILASCVNLSKTDEVKLHHHKHIIMPPEWGISEHFTAQTETHNNLDIALNANTKYTDIILSIKRNREFQELSLRTIESARVASASIEIVDDIDMDGETVIVLNLFTYGANCCTIIMFIDYDEVTKQYFLSDQLIKKWGLSPEIIDIDNDNRPEFVTREGANIWLSTALATMSRIVIYRYEDHKIKDVTLEFPQVLEQDVLIWFNAAQGVIVEVDEQYHDFPFLHTSSEFWAETPEYKRAYLLTYLQEMALLNKFNEGWNDVISLCEDADCIEYFNLFRDIFEPE
jgi:hypothetical protein